MLRSTKVQVLSIVGLVIAGYALTVESHMDEDGYEAMCDIGASFSCTEVFRSAYAHPLSLWGLVPKESDFDIGLASAGILLYSAYFLAACLWDIFPFRKHVFLTVASCGACFSCYLLCAPEPSMAPFARPSGVLSHPSISRRQRHPFYSRHHSDCSCGVLFHCRCSQVHLG
jgi:uncharacterized membrane protein